MIDKKMQALIDAPLADPKRIYLPEGKRPTTRSAPLQYGDEIGGKVSGKAVAERKKRAASEKLVALYDYYAKTDLSVEKIAQHMGIYRQEQTGVDDKGKLRNGRPCSCSAIADRNPTGGDVQQAPSRSDESGGAGTAIAQPQTPIARGG